MKLELSREETFLTHRGRPETDVRLKIGLTKTARSPRSTAEVVQRGGAYAGYGLVTILYAGALLHALYRVPASRYHGLRVYTNTPPNGAMRGHGSVDVRHAFESLLDTMAAELGLDPFAVRRANLIDGAAPDDQRPAGQLLRPRRVPRPRRARVGLARAARQAAARAWARHGVLALRLAARRSPCTGPASRTRSIKLKLDFDGGITVLTGAADIGQGSSTLIAQVVAEVLRAADVERCASSPTTAS